jgi:monovalent cation:H+ antiporter-2, CPA2 family
VHLPQLIHDLAVILAVAGVVAFIFQRIRQPVVLGYIVAGIIVGPHTPPYAFVLDLPSIKVWGEIGVIFLMFSLGLEFSFRRLMRVGLSVAVTAVVEISFMMLIGFTVGRLMGWTTPQSLFLGAIISISSTTIIIKALDEMGLKTRRFAENILGVLVVEDLFAVMILVAFTLGFSRDEFSGLVLLGAAGQLILIVGSWFIVGYFLVPWMVAHAARIGTDETLLIIAAGFCFGLVVFASRFNYSPALGAFIMGSIMAESSDSHRIEVLIRPLRDLFAAVFFVSIGMTFDITVVWENKFLALLLSAAVILGKTAGVTLGQLFTGQRFRTALQVGMGLGQIGEFSFIIAGLGLSLGVIDSTIFSVAIAVSIITAFTTPYMIKGSHKLAVSLENRFPLNVQNILNRYALYWEQLGRERESRRLVYNALFRWLINAILVTVVTILLSELLLPSLGYDLKWIGWTMALLLTAPFVWGMLTSFSRISQKGYGATVFVSRLIAITWLGVLSLEYFEFQYAILGVLMAIVVFSFLFYRRLEESYQWFESRFLKTFQDSVPTARPSDISHSLAPWDAHLVRLKVHPNAEVVGQTLQSIQLRNIYGVSIVAIRRGREDIVAPMPTFQIYPQDELFVLGSDDEVEACRSIIDKADPTLFISSPNFELRSIVIGEKSPYARMTIRETRIRDDFHSMVVGVQRGEMRLISPDSDMALNLGDVVWLVGTVQNLDALFEKLN